MADDRVQAVIVSTSGDGRDIIRVPVFDEGGIKHMGVVVNVFITLCYTPWRYVFIALVLWPFVFGVQIIKSHGTSRKRYMIMDTMGVLSVLFVTSVWSLLIFTGDSSWEPIFRIVAYCAIPLSALSILVLLSTAVQK